MGVGRRRITRDLAWLTLDAEFRVVVIDGDAVVSEVHRVPRVVLIDERRLGGQAIEKMIDT